MSLSIASLKNQLGQNPENHSIKQQVLTLLAKVKQSGQSTPLDKYLLAQFYAPNSPQYKQMMREAAAGGCPNAMLSMCELLLKSNSPADLKTVVHYMKMIENSKDSFIQKQSKLLLEDHPEAALMLKSVSNWFSSQSSFLFYKQECFSILKEQEENVNGNMNKFD